MIGLLCAKPFSFYFNSKISFVCEGYANIGNGCCNCRSYKSKEEDKNVVQCQINQNKEDCRRLSKFI